MKAKKCLVPKCIWYSAARGLCKSHYNIALKLVRARKTSWKALELLGKSIPIVPRLEGVKKWFLSEEKS